MTQPAAPSLLVRSRRADPQAQLERHLDVQPLLWHRGDFTLTGFGEALRLTFTGANRMTDAADAWRRIVATATIEDDVRLPGSGLVALGTFAFADESAAASVLIVPRVLFGRRGDDHWCTTVDTGDDVEPQLPAPFIGVRQSVFFEPGEQDPAAYRAAVTDALGRIRDGLVEKVVVARDVAAATGADFDLRPGLLALAERYPDCFMFAVDGFVGASPETLVSVQAGRVGARVLAGSAARGTDSTDDERAAAALAASAKDQGEHAFAVQSVLASLRPHSPEVTASAEPFTLRLPNLWHLASDVDGPLVDGSSSLDLLNDLHPTAAVAGTPTADALRHIRELEPFDRGRYAGPVGWVAADGDGEWAIGLRSAQLGGGRLTAWAGAGIVAGSNPEHELLETGMKFRPIIEAFGG